LFRRRLLDAAAAADMLAWENSGSPCSLAATAGCSPTLGTAQSRKHHVAEPQLLVVVGVAAVEHDGAAVGAGQWAGKDQLHRMLGRADARTGEHGAHGHGRRAAQSVT
jgi:hypothetical protein